MTRTIRMNMARSFVSPQRWQRDVVRAGREGDRENPGQIRFDILVDHGGTPTDPSDDEGLEFLGEVKGSTGRTDDYCAAALPILLGT